MREYEKQGISKTEYFSIHRWVNRRTSHKICSECGKEVRIENALIKGKKHERNLENYIPLCNSCHSKYDETNIGVVRSDEAKEKYRLAKLGTKASIETKNKMSLSHKGRNYWTKGKFGKDSNRAIPVTDDVGNVFNTVSECAKYYNMSISNISNMLNNKTKNKFNLKTTNQNET